MLGERALVALGMLLVAVVAVSAIDPYDRPTWWMETAPVLLALPLLVITYRRYPLTPLLYALIFAHAVVLIVGATYTYARVPLGLWVQDAFALARNPYDKLGHFVQGFVPVLIAREILLRGDYVSGRKMTAFLCVCTALAVSAVYELLEWWTALAFGEGAADFLGTQGDPWDAQSDMLLALIGAIASLALLSKWHDRQLARLARRG